LQNRFVVLAAIEHADDGNLLGVQYCSFKKNSVRPEPVEGQPFDRLRTNRADVLPRLLSFKHSLQLWQAWSHSDPDFDEESLGILFDLIAQRRVGNRPGRIEPRAIKRRKTLSAIDETTPSGGG